MEMAVIFVWPMTTLTVWRSNVENAPTSHLKSSELLGFTQGKRITNQCANIVKIFSPMKSLNLEKSEVFFVLNGMFYSKKKKKMGRGIIQQKYIKKIYYKKNPISLKHFNR